VANEGGDNSRGKSTAGEPNDIERIILAIVVGEEVIGLQNMGIDAPAEVVCS
jgi:hypothetical protein